MIAQRVVPVLPGPGWIEIQERIDRELVIFLQEGFPETSCLPRDVAKVVVYIHENLFDPALNVSAVKRACSVRNNNVTTRFRGHVGLGIHEYIEALRLKAAARLLCGAEVKVYLVAMAVGYVHLETFCRAFQRHFGCTPSRRREGRSCRLPSDREKSSRDHLKRLDQNCSSASVLE